MKFFEKSRRDIEVFDEKILELVALRMNAVEVIGAHKRENGLQVKDSIRERKILENLIQKGEGLGLSKEFVEKFYTIIIDHSCQIQESQQDLKR